MNLTKKDIKDLIRGHQGKRKEYKKYRNFVEGKFDLNFKEEGNKVPINYGAKVKNNVLGYFYGKPFSIQHKNEKLQEFFDEMFVYNNKNSLNIKLGSEILDVGKAYVLLYIDHNQYLKILQVKAEEMIVEYDENNDEIELAIRYFDVVNQDTDKVETKVEVYTADNTYYYIETMWGNLTEDYSRGEYIYPNNVFQKVPVIEFNNNDGVSEYRDIYGLAHLYTLLFNLGADEVEEIRNTFLLFKNAEIDEELMKEIKIRKVIDLQGTSENPADFSFVNKNANNTAFENYLELIRKRIFEIACIPDTLTINQTGMSGKAMEQLLGELEYKCITKESNMEQSLRKLMDTIRYYVRIKAGIDYKLSDITIGFTRTKSTNVVVEDIEDLVKLKSLDLFDDKTLLSLMPFVRDAQVVLDMKKKQDDERYGVEYILGNDDNEEY